MNQEQKTRRFIKRFTKYIGLECTVPFRQFVRNAGDKRIAELFNGVGSQVGFIGKATYHLIPNTIWGLNITPASDIHDFDYTEPREFDSKEDALRHKAEADKAFYRNVRKLIDRKGGWCKYGRRVRAWTYYRVLRACGKESFLAGKDIE